MDYENFDYEAHKVSTFQLGGYTCKWEPLTTREGLKVSEALMSSMPMGGSGDADMGEFSRRCFDLVLSKLRVKVNDEFRGVRNHEELGIIFTNPLVSLDIITNFMTYITPFLHCLENLKARGRNLE